MVEAEGTTARKREYAPRNALEYADKLLQAKYGDEFPLLNIDLILANLDMREREIAMAFLMAAMKLRQLEAAVQELQPLKKNEDLKEGEKPTKEAINWTIAKDYELSFCYLIDSSRALDAKTLDAATIQRLEQKSTYKEKIDEKPALYRRM